MNEFPRRCEAVMARSSEERVLCEEPADPARHDPDWHIGFSEDVGRYTWSVRSAPTQRTTPAAEVRLPTSSQG